MTQNKTLTDNEATCEVCGAGVVYGSRHHQCGSFVNKAVEAAKQETAKEIVEIKAEFATVSNHLVSRFGEEKKKVTELQSQVNMLREALGMFVKDCTGEVIHSTNWLKQVGTKALSATAKQSLIEHDNEIISKCAYICDNWKRYDVIDECCDTAQNIALLAVSDAIRALKEVK